MSTIKIYKTKLTPERNALVDNLSEYLSSLTAEYEDDNFQYQKIDLNWSVKLDLPQDNVTECIGNYADLYQDNKHYYYFVMKSRWVSKNTVELQLSIDSINTFRNDFSFNKKTNIIRQHKDRFKKVPIYFEVESSEFERLGSFTNYIDIYDQDLVGKSLSDIAEVWLEHSEDSDWVVSIQGKTFNSEQGKLTIIASNVPAGKTVYVKGHAKVIDYYKKMRNIDNNPENINPVLFKLNEDKELYEDGMPWYLIYKGSTSVTPLLCADKEFYAITPINNTINPLTLTTGKYNYITFSKYDVPKHDTTSDRLKLRFKFTDTDGNYIITDNIWRKDRKEQFGIVVEIRRISTATAEIKFKEWFWDIARGWRYVETIESYTTNGVITIEPITLPNDINSIKLYKLDNESTKLTTEIVRAGYSTINLKDTSRKINSIASIDRTDSELIKIIKLPYCPLNYKIENGLYYFNDDVVVSDNIIDLTGVNMSKDLLFDVASPIKKINYQPNTNVSLRDDINESKLYSSEFYQQKFIYDSFSFVYQLENVEFDTTRNYNKLDIKFNKSNEFNSSMLFTFNDYVINYVGLDYPNILYVNRNNEIPIYNSAYLEYIKTGYNYDVKAKTEREAANWVLTGVQIAGAIASFASSYKTGPAGIAAGISLMTSSISTIASNISQSVQADTSLQSKLAQLEKQKTNYSNCDDISLTSIYTNNVAKLVTYSVKDNTKKLIGDLFYYCGYGIGTQGIPNLTSRKWFNYIQADVVFEDETNNPYYHFLADIKQRFSTGVTVYHNVNNQYDWEQVYENWEVDFI